ncbi:MAG TPA: ATP-binding protein [Chloroflexota bacterium]|nr:ATP-binding protein [Chloroflexota bacterium]
MLAGDLAGAAGNLAAAPDAEGPPPQIALLAALTEASPDGILVVSPDGRILTYNRRFAEMWELPPDILARRSDADALEAVRRLLVEPDEFLAKVRYLYSHPTEVSREEIALRDGRTFDRYTAPMYGPDGVEYGRAWFFRDATAEKNAEAVRVQLERERAAREAALQRSARLRGLHEAALALADPVAATPTAIAALLTTIVSVAVAALEGRDGRLVLAEDPAWEGLVVGEHPAGAPVLLDHTGRLRRATQRADGATEHVLSTGELVEVPDVEHPTRFGPYDQLAAVGIRALVMAPLRTAGHIRGVLGITFNERRTLNTEDREALELFAAHAAAALERVRMAHAVQQLARQAVELARRDVESTSLRELDRLKNELLSTVSHELRTPLVVIHGYAQVIARRGGDASTPASRILAAANQLNRLVDDLVDYAQLSRGAISVRPEVVDLVPALEEIVAEFRARDGTGRLTAQLPDILPVRADPTRIRQIAGNLIENAFKYAPEGPITVHASLRTVRGREYAHVEVRDHGPGIPAAERRRVWERFFRGQQVAALNLARGTGIGLAVVKALVEAHGGRVGLSSTSGRGSRFWFELPAV